VFGGISPEDGEVDDSWAGAVAGGVDGGVGRCAGIRQCGCGGSGEATPAA